MNSGDDADTQDEFEDDFHAPVDSKGAPLISSSFVQVELGAMSHRGKVRPTNEDHYIIARADRELMTLLTNLPGEAAPVRFGEAAYGMLLADGMGGPEAGEVASRIAISTFIRLVLTTPDWIMRMDDQQVRRVMHRMAWRFREIHRTVVEISRQNSALEGMGTTLTLACSVGRQMVIAHVGDSRAYLFRDGQLRQLTRDHTMAQRLADLGVIKSSEVASHQSHSFLTDAIGSSGRGEAEVQALELRDGDRILLCSDGLTEMVDDGVIAEVLARNEPPPEACQALVNVALQRGGNDNVTVTMSRYHIPKGL